MKNKITLCALGYFIFVSMGCISPNGMQIVPLPVLEALGIKIDDGMLFRAVYHGNLRRIKELIETGTDVNVKTEYGYTPLHVAVITRNRAVVRYLLDNGADINAMNGNLETPYSLAAKKGDFELMTIILNSYLEERPGVDRMPGAYEQESTVEGERFR